MARRKSVLFGSFRHPLSKDLSFEKNSWQLCRPASRTTTTASMPPSSVAGKNPGKPVKQDASGRIARRIQFGGNATASLVRMEAPWVRPPKFADDFRDKNFQKFLSGAVLHEPLDVHAHLASRESLVHSPPKGNPSPTRFLTISISDTRRMRESPSSAFLQSSEVLSAKSFDDRHLWLLLYGA